MLRNGETLHGLSLIETVRMKNIVIIFAVICCVGATSLYLLQIKKQQKLLKVLADLQYDYNQKHDSEAFKIATLKEDMNTCYANEGETLSNVTLLENGIDKINLSDVIEDKTLIIRLSQLNCQACIMAITPLLHKLKNERVIFLMDYTNKRYFKEFKKTCNDNHRLFKIDSLLTSLDTLNIPYFFLLDKSLKTDCAFVPHKEMLGQTEKYLEIIKKRIAIK